ncbi:helix-turn-helix transcriptional regulator [Streptomyces sp. YC504]|uniref:Helix-turn-helix transcriptional regulator n=1 Tax=Streptomyces mesophilus TaxID=1775132 RepID=A0A6G4XC62_9ACTN|nr:helix-turn-helix domain-containing protein [Streptomyces mesophilus]NGO74450.1 helix-turn-helix transcriptional regulator [Streptomyces mesophilus]
MLRQPAFGQRLKKMRAAQGLSQTALAGDGMSTGYLSRLESGARQPTDRAVAYLAERLGVQPADFEAPAGGSLANALSLAASTGADDALVTLQEALSAEGHESPVLRWQAVWLLAEHCRRQVDFEAERVHLEELIRLGDQVGLVPLRVRGLSRLSRCVRALGDIPYSLELAMTAHQLSREHALGVDDLAGVLLALLSAQSEAGRLTEAQANADELITLVEGRTDSLWAESLWGAAAIRARQGDDAGAARLLQQALDGFSSKEDLVLWLRLRIAAGRSFVVQTPPDAQAVQACITGAEQALAFVGTDGLRQQLNSLKVEYAFLTSRYDDAGALLDELAQEQLRMSHRDQVRLDIFRNQLRIRSGDPSGVDGLRALAEQAHADANLDLAAHIWRLLAKALTEMQQDAADAVQTAAAHGSS